MKKFLLITMACLLFVCTAASANEWNLRGGIYDVVTQDNRYEGYSCLTTDADDGNQLTLGRHVNHAILQNRYHAVLIAAWRDEGKWAVETTSTTAVYQPGDKRGEYPNAPGLSHTSEGFVLTYGDSERYEFAYTEGEYRLTRVEYYDPAELSWSNSYILHSEGLMFWQSGPGETFLPIGDALWRTDGITLAEFNIAQMPRSMAEVRRLNQTRAALEEAADALSVQTAWAGEANGLMLPVYSAPDAASYRSGSGKAAVSLKASADILGTVEGWTLLQYEVSPRTGRIGWVEGTLANDVDLGFANIPLVAAVDTFLTDDPLVSQYAQADIPAGTVVTGLALMGEYYAYVEYEGDVLYRGFVPLKDLQPKYDMAWGGNTLSANVRWDVMDALCGKWYVPGFPNSVDVFYTDGTWRMRKNGEYIEEGSYRVFDRSDGKYDLIIRTEDNRAPWYILTLNEDATITLTTTEGVQTFHRDEYSTYGNG